MILVPYLLGFYAAWGVFSMPVPMASAFGLMCSWLVWLCDRPEANNTAGDSK